MDQAEAIERARHEADARLWPWIEPLKIRRRRSFLCGPLRWRVQTNAANTGLHVIIVMDGNGRVLRANVQRH